MDRKRDICGQTFLEIVGLNKILWKSFTAGLIRALNVLVGLMNLQDWTCFPKLFIHRTHLSQNTSWDQCFGNTLFIHLFKKILVIYYVLAIQPVPKTDQTSCPHGAYALGIAIDTENYDICFCLSHSSSMTLNLNKRSSPRRADPGSRAISRSSVQRFFFRVWLEMKIKLPPSTELREGYNPGGYVQILLGRII